MNQKVSFSSVRALLGVFGIPALAAALIIYAFYVTVPLTYIEKKEFKELDTRVIKVEESLKQLPTVLQIKMALEEVLREHGQ